MLDNADQEMPRFAPSEEPDQPQVDLDTLTWENAEETYVDIFMLGVYAPRMATVWIDGEEDVVQIDYDLESRSANMFLYESQIDSTSDNPSGVMDKTSDSPDFDRIFGKGWREFLSDYERDCQDEWADLDDETRERYAERGYH